MLAQGVPARLARLGSALASRLTQPAPCISGVRYLGLYDDKERGDEVRMFDHDAWCRHSLMACGQAQSLTFVLADAAGALCKGGREAAAQPVGEGQGAGGPGTQCSGPLLCTHVITVVELHACTSTTLVRAQSAKVEWQLQVDQEGAEKTLDAEMEQLKVGLHALLMFSSAFPGCMQSILYCTG